MSDDLAVYPGLGSALNARFRGHADRDWEEWRVRHYYGDAASIPDSAAHAWLGREQKHGFRGISGKPALRHLIVGNADQAVLDEVGQVHGLERLELEGPMLARELSPLLALASLRFLSIDSPRHLADFAPLLDLPGLSTLIITNAKGMANLDWLSAADRLEVIGIEGGMWSPMTIPTLQPLAGLASLRAFLGTSTKLGDKQLMPLADCPSLRFVGIARVAARDEFERLHQARPDIYCDWFQPGMWKTRTARKDDKPGTP